jgi:hypothetical protein
VFFISISEFLLIKDNISMAWQPRVVDGVVVLDKKVGDKYFNDY